MDAAELEQTLNAISSHAVVCHGYTNNMRDYEIVVRDPADLSAEKEPPHRRYVFRYCIGALCFPTVSPETWKQSLHDSWISQEGQDSDAAPEESAGSVAWLRFPCAEVPPPSKLARRWSEALGIKFHDVFLRTSIYRLHLLFSELQVTEVRPDTSLPRS
ncbi:hypothetical protein ACFC0D_03270 [Streptomyces sp. NPDC056222]|uniref:YxiG-like protein n=1 Tax=Streptomyces sp. NPDC056222 TaxID=3345749 RepID=UPI0035D95E79